MKGKRIVSIIGASMLALALTACGSSGSGSYAASSDSYKQGAATTNAMAPMEAGWSYDEEAAYGDTGYDGSTSDYETGNYSSTGTTGLPKNRKLIRNANLSVETKEFDTFMGILEDEIGAAGGYVESMNSYNGSRYSSSSTVKSASITARIPAANLDEFITVIGNAGNITRKSENVDDITLTYVDTESHRDMLKAELESLTGMLEKAETLEDMLMLEERITNVRYQLESQERQLRSYDSLVDYSTVYIDVSEVQELTVVAEPPKTVWERISQGFSNSLGSVGKGLTNFFVWFVVSIPYLIIWAIVIIVIVFICKALFGSKAQAKRAAKNAERMKAQMEAAQMRNAAAGAQPVQQQPQAQPQAQTQPQNPNPYK